MKHLISIQPPWVSTLYASRWCRRSFPSNSLTGMIPVHYLCGIFSALKLSIRNKDNMEHKIAHWSTIILQNYLKICRNWSSIIQEPWINPTKHIEQKPTGALQGIHYFILDFRHHGKWRCFMLILSSGHSTLISAPSFIIRACYNVIHSSLTHKELPLHDIQIMLMDC